MPLFLGLAVSFSLAEARCGDDEIRVPQLGVGLEEYSEDVRARIRAVEQRFQGAAVLEDGTPPGGRFPRVSPGAVAPSGAVFDAAEVDPAISPGQFGCPQGFFRSQTHFFGGLEIFPIERLKA